MSGYAYAAKQAATEAQRNPDGWPPGWDVPDSDDDPWPPGWPIAQTDYTLDLTVPETVQPDAPTTITGFILDDNGDDADDLNLHVLRISAKMNGEVVQMGRVVSVFSDYLYARVSNYTGARYGLSEAFYFHIHPADAGKTVTVTMKVVSVTPNISDTGDMEVASEETLDCGVGNAVAAGMTATLSQTQTLACGKGNAVAAGLACSNTVIQVFASGDLFKAMYIRHRPYDPPPDDYILYGNECRWTSTTGTYYYFQKGFCKVAIPITHPVNPSKAFLCLNLSGTPYGVVPLRVYQSLDDLYPPDYTEYNACTELIFDGTVTIVNGLNVNVIELSDFTLEPGDTYMFAFSDAEIDADGVPTSNYARYIGNIALDIKA